LSFSTSLCFGLVSSPRAEDLAGDYGKIHAGMDKLAPLAGKWRAIARFHNGEKTIENDGAYDIGWALEQTYLECRVELHSKNDPSHHHELIIYITYNPATRRYESKYLYTRWALRVTETGEHDASKREFLTNAAIPLENGVHDEFVNTVTDLSDPKKIVYSYYRRYSSQKSERMDVQITLTRQQ
jgi:hypothetical protein